MRDDIQRLQMIELQLKDDIQNLSQQRNSLIMELQQLQEAKPVLEKAYAVRGATFTRSGILYLRKENFFSQRSSHPSLMQRIQQLEMKNRHLQQCLKQQQQYTETIMNRKWIVLFCFFLFHPIPFTNLLFLQNHGISSAMK